MLRFLYSGISGMKADQQKMDVIGNNISNVGTTSFKAGRVRFSDMLSQTTSDAMAPTTSQGGVNPSQVGLGVQVAGVDTLTGQGNLQPTGSNLDFAIDGDGYFMVGKGPAVYNDGTIDVNQSAGMHNIDTTSLSKSNMDLMYTRDGSFTKDKEGNLLTSDGYRVMGYSVTNDDTTKAATSKFPNSVSTGGFTFQYGPGAQLNGYAVALGNVGPDTVASANVDKENKLIILNGDFSSSDGITAAQAKTAINKALSSAGISQTVNVNGNETVIRNIASDAIKGGADAKSPNSVSSSGFTFDFNSGSQLNGYTIQVGNIAAGTPVTASADTTNKIITINGDFVTPNAVSTNALRNAINKALTDKNITQTVAGVSGNAVSIPQISGTANGKGSVPKQATLTGKLGGLTVALTTGGQLNGYTIKLGTITSGTITSAKIDQNAKTITVNGDFTGSKDAATLASEVQNMISAQLASANMTQPTVTVSAPAGTVLDTSSSVTIGSDGADDAAPSDVSVGGIDLSFNNGSTFNGYTVELGKIGKGTATAVNINTTTKKITIDGDFINPNGFRTSDLQDAIDTAVSAAVTAGTLSSATSSTGTVKITATGSPVNYTGLLSSAVGGGSDLQSPGSVTAEGFTFQLTPGGELNGYDIEVGTITSGTPTSASVDTDKKKIIISGDFTTLNGITANAIQTAINDQLTAKGISQSISVTGSPYTINGVQSNAATGGTPVQSINNDGVIDFVDGTKELKSYDGNLKCLKIPDKIYDAANDQYLKITKYTIEKNGVLNAVLEDGRVAALGQIAMASFNNPAGLSKLGNNLYSSSVNSGDPTLRSGVGTTGEDNSKGYGDVYQGELEMSNVDLAEQFTDMIETTRAFQANAKVISSGDDILQDILNLKR